MKKVKILIGIGVVVLAVLVALYMTKPDRTAHYETIKKEVALVVDREMNSNSLWKDYAALGIMRVLNVMDGFLGRLLIVYDHTFYNVGVVVYKDQLIPVSIGVAGHVWLTVGEEDLELLVKSPDVMNMIGAEDIQQVMELMQKVQKSY